MLEGAKKRAQSVTKNWDSTTRLINGVIIKDVKSVVSHNAVITELFRNDWGLSDNALQQATLLGFHPGVTTAWDLHERQTDHVMCIKGLLRLALYDHRNESPTHGDVNIFHLSEKRPQLIVIPANIWHAFQNLSNETSQIVNFFSQRFRHEEPDSWHLPSDTDKIPYRFPPL